MGDQINLIDGLNHLGSRIKKYWLTIVVLNFSILALASLLVLILPKQYKYVLTGHSSAVPTEVLVRVIESLDVIADNRDYEQLADILKIEKSQAKHIRHLKMNEIYPEFITSDRSRYFILTIISRAKTNYSELQKSILNYLENNEYLKIRKNMYTEAEKRAFTKTIDEINSVELMRTRFLNNELSTDKLIFMNPADFSSKIIELTKQKNSLEISIALNDQVKLVHGFTGLSKPSFPKWEYFIIGALVTCLFVNIIFLAAIFDREI